MRQRQHSDTLKARPLADGHADLHLRFCWQVPRHFNMAEVCSRRWSSDPPTPAHTAVIASAPGRDGRQRS